MLQNEIAISGQGLKKSYKSVTVLEGVDLVCRSKTKTASKRMVKRVKTNGYGLGFTAEMTAVIKQAIKNELNRMVELIRELERSVNYVFISIKPYEKL